MNSRVSKSSLQVLQVWYCAYHQVETLVQSLFVPKVLSI